ncbi:uncharacterized protein LOC110924338 [Helianthus annuus]|uniref:uncharacterized protein LOC110924338 n=1 Tax=Helianthus annuus TaxID=4232 RepID=UPI001653067E|nr:uncharacterized protein LOC110924338 [Helianthus annuus]
MALVFHKPVVQEMTVEDTLSVFCTPECRQRVEVYRIHNAELIQDYQDIKNKNFSLSKNEKLYKEKIEAQRKDIIKLKDDVSVKTAHFLEAQEKVCILTKELEDIRNRYQINELNIKKFDSSSKLVKNLCDQQLAYKEKKGRGLGYNQTPPPYNDNYTYLPMTEEEMMNESKMTYGSKNNKSSVHDRHVEPQKSTPLNFVPKGTIDPNVSSSCADDSSECGDDCFSANVCDPNVSNVSVHESVTDFSKEEAVTLTEKSQENVSKREIKTETESSFQNDPVEIIKDEKHHPSESHDCASSDQQVQKNSEKAHGTQATQARSSRPTKSATAASCQNIHTLKRQTCFNCGIPGHIARNCVHRPKVQRNANTHSCADVCEPVHNKRNESKQADQSRGYAKSAYQGQSRSHKVHEKVIESSNKGEKTKNGAQSNKTSANNKYKHPNSSSSKRNVQAHPAQKGPVCPSGPARANQAAQNVFPVKRQTCYNCGIAGHIARNCTRRPYVLYYMQNQRVTSKDTNHSKPMKSLI